MIDQLVKTRYTFHKEHACTTIGNVIPSVLATVEVGCSKCCICFAIWSADLRSFPEICVIVNSYTACVSDVYW